MGSGPSKKKVAPACVSEVNATKTAVTSPKRDSRPFKPLKIHAILANARNRASPDCHSEGHDSDFSAEDDDVVGELDAALKDYGQLSVKKNGPKKTFIKARSYGLCHFSQEDTEDELQGSAHRASASGRVEGPRGSRGGSVNKRSNDAFIQLQSSTPLRPSQQNVRTCILVFAFIISLVIKA